MMIAVLSLRTILILFLEPDGDFLNMFSAVLAEDGSNKHTHEILLSILETITFSETLDCVYT